MNAAKSAGLAGAGGAGLILAYLLVHQSAILPAPHCFNQFWDVETVPPIVGTFFVTQWDQLQNQWQYDFQIAATSTGTWTTVDSGVWTSSDTNAYFGLDLPEVAGNQFQRAIGTPLAGIALERVAAPFSPLKIHYRGKAYRPWFSPIATAPAQTPPPPPLPK